MQGSAPRPMKKKLVQALAPVFASLAALPAPSRFVEALFLWGDTADKEVIVSALSERLQALQSSRIGAPLCQVCQVELWVRSAEEWRRRVTGNERMSAQFQRLFGDSPAAVKKGKEKRKKRQRQEDPAAIGAPAGDRMKAQANELVSEVMAELGIVSAGGGHSKEGRQDKRARKAARLGEGQDEDASRDGRSEEGKVKKRKKRAQDAGVQGHDIDGGEAGMGQKKKKKRRDNDAQ